MDLNRLKIKSIFAFPILTLGLALGACSEESGVESPQEPSIDRGQTVTFKANPLDTETKSVGTKVSLNPQINPANPDELSWESTDKISFHFFDKSTNHHFTPAAGFSVSVSADGSADLTGDIPANAGTYNMYAISPMSADNFKSNQLGFRNLTIPQVQVQSGNRNTDHISDYLYLYAKMDDALEVRGTDDWAGTANLDFQLMPSILRFDIENWSGKDLKLKDLKISYPDAGTGTLYQTHRLYEDSGDLLPISNGAYESITLDMQSSVLNQNDVYSGYIVLFPTTAAGKLNIDIALIADNDLLSLKLSADVPSFEASNKYNIDVLVDDDMLSGAIPEIGESIIYDKVYKTTTINIGEPDQLTIMIDPVDWGEYNYTRQIYLTHPIPSEICPAPWRLATPVDLSTLREQMRKDPSIEKLLTLSPNCIYRNISGQFDMHDEFIFLGQYQKNEPYIQQTEHHLYNSIYTYEGFVANNTNWSILIAYSHRNPDIYYVPIRCVKS
jgi:hypothetical protein